jgi:hypothetical protein
LKERKDEKKMAEIGTITVKYGNNVKVVPYEGKNVYGLRKHLQASVLHQPDKDGKRVNVDPSTVKAYINGLPAEDGDVVTIGETLEFSATPLKPAAKTE